MSLLNMLHINMKKISVDYIPKINGASSVEFRGMKNRAKLEVFFFLHYSLCVSCEKNSSLTSVKYFRQNG